MKSTCIITIATTLLAFSTAQARLGETEQEVEARYGKPIATIDPDPAMRAVAYQHKGFVIMVTYENGKSGAEIYQKPDKSEITDPERTVLLEANAGGYKWTYKEEVPGQIRWFNVDRKSRIAWYDTFNHQLCITSAAHADRVSAITKRRTAEKLKDF
jgi:hypothetical protein